MGRPKGSKNLRSIRDKPTRARIWADCIISGRTIAARVWGISYDMTDTLFAEYDRDPDFAALADEELRLCRERLVARADEAQAAAVNALLAALQKTGHSLRDLAIAYETTARVAGRHLGDAKAAENKSGAGIVLPLILTQPREDKPAGTGNSDGQGNS
jgi:hypothetical protein